MKCEDVQFQLWSGLNSGELTEHLKTCSACQAEKNAMQGIMDRLSDLDIPTTSRSLKPSQAVIRSAVQRNKRMRWMRSTAVAASITVLLGTAAAIGWNQFNASPQDMTGNSNDQTAVSEPKVAPTVPDTMNQKQELVAVSDQANNHDLCVLLQNHLLQNVKQDEVKSIVITDLQRDPGNGQAQPDVVTGTVTLDVKLQPGAVSAFKEGTQKAAVQFNKKDGDYFTSVFELTLKPAQSPSEVLKMYTASMRTREGMRVYALYTPEKRQQLRKTFADQFWSVGQSSPWIESFEVISENTQGDKSTIEARLNLASSAGSAGVQMATFTMQRQQGKFWYLEDVKIMESTRHYPTATLDLGNGTLDSLDKEVDFEGVKVSLFAAVTYANGDGEMMQLVGNHAGILKQQQVQTAAGPATLMTVERDAPAATGGGTSKEYWLAALRDTPSVQDGRFGLAIVLKGNVDEKTAYDKLQRLGNKWRITE